VAPGNVAAHLAHGQALQQLGRADAAIASFRTVAALQPDLALGHFHLGSALARSGRYEESLPSLDRAIALDGSNATAFADRANALGALHRFSEALASYDGAIAIQPDFVEAWCSRGRLQCDACDPDGAVESLDRAVAIDPQFAAAYINRGFARLLKGDLVSGWQDNEWRWRARGTPTWQERRQFPQPRWSGQPLAGRTLFLHREQGLGDALQFCRYIPLLADAGATVILEIHAPLMRLFAGLRGVAQLIERGAAVPPFDYWCPLLSLPLAFRTDLATIPADIPYLHADPDRVQYWERRLAAAGSRPRIGLVWSGGAVHPNDHNRSMALDQLLPHLPAGCHYVSLQKEVRPLDHPALGAHPWLLHVGEELHDFSDTAALCRCLDLVISIDSSVAHLAGALGAPVWILLPHSPDWRWLLNRDDSPWYPSARLYRQPQPGDWDGLLRRVGADLGRRFSL